MLQMNPKKVLNHCMFASAPIGHSTEIGKDDRAQYELGTGMLR